ncbi:transcriptional coactivator p15/PC4 family protein [bacterium]|nr:transcriptional coactivator p15/PC4 family protein [candidate division CSSED10-310 bacterium]
MAGKNEIKEIGTIKKRDDVEIRASVSKFRDEYYVDIREYIETPNYTGPTKKGLRFHVENWEDFRSLVEKIDQFLQKTL